ncbi:MAG TPA: hypothetical protein VMR92_11170 [Gemmatimonadales bacterium]|nr:hypothetical protein [Gemmatimonadales bacterium]
MRPRWFVVLVVLRLAVAGYAGAVPADRPLATASPDFSSLERTTITPGSKRGELLMELPPVDLPAGAMVKQPASLAEFPVDGSIYAVRAEIVDMHGRQLPLDLLHHMNVMNPNERELFLPISRRILASGRETGEIRFPWLLFGTPVRAREPILANAMVHNPTATDYHGVRVRLVLDYVPAGRPWPFFSVIPWQLDVAFPVGDKTFDLPAGHSERSYEGSPAVAGKLIAIGGHMHVYGKAIEFWDATTGERLWRGEPAPAAPGEAGQVPTGTFYSFTGIGVRLTPEHHYRVRVLYDNPTGKMIPEGGMGVVGGLFSPERDAVWPTADHGDSLYQKDLKHFMGTTQPAGAMPMPMEHSHAGH